MKLTLITPLENYKIYTNSIWERFKKATKVINDKRQEYFSHLDELYEKNLEFKQGIIGLIEEKTAETVDSHKGWQTKIKEIEMLREEFFKGGKVPIKVNEATWSKFKEAVRKFNRKKNEFYKSLKNDQYENLKKKKELIKIAEDNKDSEDFETTTSLMKKIQSDWKTIGHVPRKDSDKVWKQFKGACNHYFDRIKAQRNANSEVEEKAYIEKDTLLKIVKDTKLTGEQKTDLASIKDYIAKWKKFDNKLQDLSSASDPRVLQNERAFISKKISEVKSEINQLQNNLLFFKHADEKNPLVKSVHDNIKKHEDSLDIWNKKLNKIKVIYNAEAKAEAQAKAAAEAEAQAALETEQTMDTTE